MFALLKDSIRKIYPPEARRLWGLNTFKGQRPVNKNHVDELVKASNMGLFTMGWIAVARNGKEDLLANGQHVLKVIERTNKPHRCVVSEYECPTANDVWLLFSTFDHHRKRNFRDTMRAARESGALPGDLTGIPVDVLSRAGKAVYIANMADPVFVTVPDKAQVYAVKRYAEEIEFIALMAASSQPRTVTSKIGMCVAMAKCYRANKKKALEFFPDVITGENLTAKDPAYKLRGELIDPKPTQGTYKGAAAQREFYVRAVSWWNVFVSGEKKSSIRYRPDKDLPKVLK
jgi:hypothetical protein